MPSPNIYGARVCASDRLGPNKTRSTFTEAVLPANHMIFGQTATPISLKLGFPLVICKLNTRTIDTNNPRATHLMIEPESLLAPMEWQSNVGDVIVMRADKEPLSVKDFTAFSDYVWEILQTSEVSSLDAERAGWKNNYDPRRYYEPAMLAEYMENYPRWRNIKFDSYNFPEG